MKFNVKRFGCAVSTVWALIVFLTGVANLIFKSYGVGSVLVRLKYVGTHGKIRSLEP